MVVTKRLLEKEIEYHMSLYKSMKDVSYALALDWLNMAKMIYKNYRNNYNGDIMEEIEKL